MTSSTRISECRPDLVAPAKEMAFGEGDHALRRDIREDVTVIWNIIDVEVISEE